MKTSLLRLAVLIGLELVVSAHEGHAAECSKDKIACKRGDICIDGKCIKEECNSVQNNCDKYHPPHGPGSDAIVAKKSSPMATSPTLTEQKHKSTFGKSTTENSTSNTEIIYPGDGPGNDTGPIKGR